MWPKSRFLAIRNLPLSLYRPLCGVGILLLLPVFIIVHSRYCFSFLYQCWGVWIKIYFVSEELLIRTKDTYSFLNLLFTKRSFYFFMFYEFGLQFYLNAVRNLHLNNTKNHCDFTHLQLKTNLYLFFSQGLSNYFVGIHWHYSNTQSFNDIINIQWSIWLTFIFIRKWLKISYSYIFNIIFDMSVFQVI